MTQTIKPRVVIVDKNDKIIGHKHRGTLNKEDIYRVSALWITNSQKEILLARRHHTKTHDPRKWGPAVAGTVDEGESYVDNIINEFKIQEDEVEEIKWFSPKEFKKELMEHPEEFLPRMKKYLELFQ